MKLSIRDLEAAGMSDRQIVQLLKEVEAGRREKARIKKRKQRARPRDSRDMGDKRDTYVIEPSFFPEEEKKRKKEGSTHTLDPNWAPSKNDIAYARDRDWTLDRIEQEAERFRLYYLEKQTLISDDHLRWCKWVTSKFQQNGGQNGHGRRRGSVLDAADRLIEQLGGEEAARRYVPGSEGPRPLNVDNIARPADLGSYRKDDFADPESYLIQLGMVLERFDDKVIEAVTSPITGIQRTCKFPPGIAEFIEFIDEHVRRTGFAANYDARSQAQIEEREQFERDQREPLEYRREVVKRVMAEYKTQQTPDPERPKWKQFSAAELLAKYPRP